MQDVTMDLRRQDVSTTAKCASRQTPRCWTGSTKMQESCNTITFAAPFECHATFQLFVFQFVVDLDMVIRLLPASAYYLLAISKVPALRATVWVARLEQNRFFWLH
jgi:hypothetical protein